MATRPPRDKSGSALKVRLTAQEFKRLDFLFQTKGVVNDIAEGQRMLDKLVAGARKNGATWAEIGESAGMSAQSAHTRWAEHSSQRSKRSSTVAAPARTPRLPVKREVQQVLV
jgi:hypothetical protein